MDSRKSSFAPAAIAVAVVSCPHPAGEGGSPRPPADLPPDGSNI